MAKRFFTSFVIASGLISLLTIGSRGNAASDVSRQRNRAPAASDEPKQKSLPEGYSVWRADVNTTNGPQTQILLIQAKAKDVFEIQWEELHLDHSKVFEHRAIIKANVNKAQYAGQTKLLIDYGKILGGHRPVCDIPYRINLMSLGDDKIMIDLPRLTQFHPVIALNKVCSDYYSIPAATETYVFEKLESDSSEEAEAKMTDYYRKQINNVNWKYAKFHYENRRTPFVIVGQVKMPFSVANTFLGIKYDQRIEERLLFVTNDGRFLKVDFDTEESPYLLGRLPEEEVDAEFSFYHQSTDVHGRWIVGNLERRYPYRMTSEEFKNLLSAGIKCKMKYEFSGFLLGRRLIHSCL